jgi:hypothetical protein
MLLSLLEGDVTMALVYPIIFVIASSALIIFYASTKQGPYISCIFDCCSCLYFLSTMQP